MIPHWDLSISLLVRSHSRLPTSVHTSTTRPCVDPSICVNSNTGRRGIDGLITVMFLVQTREFTKTTVVCYLHNPCSTVAEWVLFRFKAAPSFECHTHLHTKHKQNSSTTWLNKLCNSFLNIRNFCDRSVFSGKVWVNRKAWFPTHGIILWV